MIIGVLLVALLSSYVVFTRWVVRDLQREATRSSQEYTRVYRALIDTSEFAGTQALLELSKNIVAEGVPLVITDRDGVPGINANVPPEIAHDQARLRQFVRDLDRETIPVTDSLVGQIHYGRTPLVKWLNIIPALQALSAFVLLLAAVYIVRTRGNAERERVWAGMARESAHQLGTPLSSLSGWIELRKSVV